MTDAATRVPSPRNEPVLAYAPRSSERAAIRAALENLSRSPRDLVSIIDGEARRGSKQSRVLAPHDRALELGTLHVADAHAVAQAIAAAQRAKPAWAAMRYQERAAVFLRAAEILAGPRRYVANAATMLGQSKTVHQAEIDAACELIDFWRFNAHFGQRILEEQPLSSSEVWNRLDYRPLDGFVLAVTPFNFSSIGGNLPTAPALMGNTVVWKPAATAALSAQYVMDILMEAGLPPGVINLVHAPGRVVGEVALKHPDLAGVHFTGSTATFQGMWRTIGENIAAYRSYPRIVGETGGKDFIFAHASADVDALAVAIVRGAFEFQGQKCSAVSRVYVPESLWAALSERLAASVGAIKVGDVKDFSNFMGAVIDQESFDRIKGYIEHARASHDAKVWLGGECSAERGYFIRPTVVIADNPRHRIMCEEIFGPVVSIHRYADRALDEALHLCDTTSPYALTGAVFARDRQAIVHMQAALRFSAGNFYINDKPTGAVVGQQPFGGARASGTNDKAGALMNLLRWTSARAIKETFVPPADWRYPFMQPE